MTSPKWGTVFPHFFRLARELQSAEVDFTSDSGAGGDNRIRRDSAPLNEANAVSSRVGADTHKIVLDIDHDAALVPSSTPGHWHLIIDHILDWPKYAELLTALATAGVIEQGYANASIMRKATWIRTPWTKK